jgi:pimeloyl-ACP methyl ester carboxylesterase
MFEKELNYQGYSIFYRLIGSGKPVILLHGFGEDGNVWKNQIQFLKEKFQLIIPDLPGSGKSGMIDDMSIEGMAEVIKAIIDKENIVPLTLIGHSMGGYITLALAEKHPEHLNSFGLFHSTAYADNDEKKVARQKAIETIKQYGAFEFLRKIIPNLFSPVSKEKMPERINEFVNGTSNFSPTALISYYEAMMKRPERTNVLKKAKVPVLFIMGKYDTAAPLEDVLKQSHLPEKSSIHILERSGHMGMMEEPDKSNMILKKFLSM